VENNNKNQSIPKKEVKILKNWTKFKSTNGCNIFWTFSY